VSRLVAVALAALSLVPAVAVAQEATPAADPSGRSLAYLPAAAALGDGWTATPGQHLDVSADVFIDASAVTYLGPGGARVLVRAYVNQPGRTALQRSWEAVTEDGDAIRSGLWLFVRELGTPSLPGGCVDAKRFEGADPVFAIAVGITQCAAEPDVTILVVASGTVDGRSGAAASDHVASLAVQAGTS
jgi:hypothetical protein